MILLRPYAVYNLSDRDGLQRDPVKVNALLQRLIKKKEEHHTIANDDTIAVTPSKTALPLLAFLTLFLNTAFSLIVARFKSSKTNFALPGLPCNKHHLVSRLQL